VFGALTARVAWVPELTKDVLDLYALDGTTFPDIPSIPILNLALKPTLFFLNGYHHLVFAKNGHCIQLRILGSLCLDRARLVAAVFMESVRLRGQLTAISCLNDLRDRGDIMPAFISLDNRSKRLSLVLHALDGKLAGQTNREIAVSLFGERRVQAEWGDPGEYLQDQVRRAIRRGQQLMEGGYRSLLR